MTFQYPKLYICLLTYARTDYACRTLRSMLEHLAYSGPISVHIADDGSPQEHRDTLVELAGGFGHIQGVTVSNSDHRGYGPNYNLGLQTCQQHADVWMPVEDDWELRRPLNLDPLVEDLMLVEKIGCIRLGYVGWTQELRGEFLTVLTAENGGRAYVVFGPRSPERHVFAGHPRVERIDWAQAVGPWPEGLTPGQTEFAVCAKPEARQGVAFPVHLTGFRQGLVHHIGTMRSTDA